MALEHMLLGILERSIRLIIDTEQPPPGAAKTSSVLQRQIATQRDASVVVQINRNVEALLLGVGVPDE